MRLQIDKFETIYYGPLKSNRPVEDSGGSQPYLRVDSWAWTKTERQHGKTIKIKGFPAKPQVKLLRVVRSTQRTDSIVTNERVPNHVKVVPEVCGFRWKVEPFHRETKQLTGIEKNPCRTAKSIRNPIGGAI